MAEERLDGIVVTARFDDAGLDASVTAALASVAHFRRQAETIMSPTVRSQLDFDVSSLDAAQGNISKFFAGLRQGIQEGIEEALTLAEAIRNVPPLPR